MLDQLRRVSTSIHPQISSRTATPATPARLVHSSKPSRTALEQTQSEVMNRPDQDRATAAETDSKNSPTPPPPRLRTVSRTAPAVDVAVVVNASKNTSLARRTKHGLRCGLKNCLQCFAAVGWTAGRASGL